MGLNLWIFVCGMDRYCQEFALILNTLNLATEYIHRSAQHYKFIYTRGALSGQQSAFKEISIREQTRFWKPYTQQL
jgi:hypothetical protein